MKPALQLHSQQGQQVHPTPPSRPVSGMLALLLGLGLLNRVLVAAAGIVISSATIRPVEHLFALELQLGQDRVRPISERDCQAFTLWFMVFWLSAPALVAVHRRDASLFAALPNDAAGSPRMLLG